MVIRLSPTSNGISPVDQFVVPLAIPDGPVEFVHETSTTPTVSWAVPLMTITGRLVETLVTDGFVMVKDGAVTSGVLLRE